MNSVLLSLLIVAASPSASIGGHDPQAEEVLRAAFAQSSDEDYDGWPDHWTRRHGPGFPHYNKMLLCDESPPTGGRSLRMTIDGGGAVACSPPVPISPQCDYILEADVKTAGLEHDRAFLSLSVLNDEGQAVQTFRSRPIRDAPQWTRLRLGPVSPDAADARAAIIGLHLEPAARQDLKGAALFGGIWLGRLARIALTADQPTGVYVEPGSIAVTCTVSGLSRPGAKATLALVDLEGRTVAQTSQAVDLAGAPARRAAKDKAAAEEPPLWQGAAQWKPPVPGPGFYRVQASIEGSSSQAVRRELSLAVIRAEPCPGRSEFGWSLAQGDGPLPLATLGQLLAQAGIGWAKCPLWLDSAKGESPVQQWVPFLEQASLHGIEMIGVLDRAPDAVLARLDPSRPPSIAVVLSADRQVWSPSLEWLMQQLGTYVRWWQLGGDADTSFVGYPGLAGKIAQLKTALERDGCELNLGLAWSWQHPLPAADSVKAPWRFVSLSAEPPLTPNELASYLPPTRGEAEGRCVVIRPLERRVYALEDRAADLVQQMLAAKTHGAQWVMVADPFHPAHGLMNADGTPGELFLPWRTTALMLGGAARLESVCLPNGSTNAVFARARDAVMVVWNPTPTRETLYLGENVRHLDLWGRERKVLTAAGAQQIEVGPLPTFVTGLCKAVAEWRGGVALAQDRIASIFGQRQPNRIEFRNTFGLPVEADLTLIAPEQWSMRPDRARLRLAAGETARHDFEIALPSNASSGPQLLRLDFELTAERKYRFSVYRAIRVGSGDARIEVVTQLNDQGELEVQQWTINQGDKPVSYRCQLFAPGRQRLSTQVAGLGRGQDLQIYRLPEGRQLLGKTLWLQAQETDGPQVLNHRFVARE